MPDHICQGCSKSNRERTYNEGYHENWKDKKGVFSDDCRKKVKCHGCNGTGKLAEEVPCSK